VQFSLILFIFQLVIIELI